MPAWVAPAVSAGLSLASGLFGGGAQRAAERRARRLEQQKINAQFKYDTSVYDFNWKQEERKYEFALKDTEVQRQNQENNLRWQEQTAANDYAHTLAIRNFEYSNQVRAYNQSEKVYGDQRRLNLLASQDALANESRRYNEIIKGMAFEHQDMLVKMIQGKGAAAARGGQGRSAGRITGNVMAQYGRNQAIQAASLISSERESLANEKQIYADRYEADVAADARRMLQPLLAPTPAAPIPLPRATILDPLKPEKGPAPIKGVNTMPVSGGLSIAANIASAASNAFGAYTQAGGPLPKFMTG